MLSKNIFARGLATAATNGLKNGVKVATEATGGPLTSVSVVVNAGSRHDAAHGSARLLTRLSSRGTKKRNPDQLRADLQAVGGHFSAKTDREHISYTLTVLNKDAGRAVELLGDIVTNPNLDDKFVNEEKAAQEHEGRCIQTEMFEHLHETAFHETPLGRTISGAEVASKLTKNDVQSFYNTFVTGDRVNVSIVGGFDGSAASDAAAQHFAGINTSTAPVKVLKVPFVGSDKRIRFDSMQRAHVYIAYQVGDYNSSDAYTTQVAQTLTGSWDKGGVVGIDSASRLARELAENNLVDKFSSFSKLYSDTGLFGIHFTAADNHLEHASWHVMTNLARLAHNTVDEEVERSKAQLLTRLLQQEDNVTTAAQRSSLQLAQHGRRITREELAARIHHITTADIKAWANNRINDEDHVLAAKGPIYELPDYNYYRRRSYLLRY